MFNNPTAYQFQNLSKVAQGILTRIMCNTIDLIGFACSVFEFSPSVIYFNNRLTIGIMLRPIYIVFFLISDCYCSHIGIMVSTCMIIIEGIKFRI